MTKINNHTLILLDGGMGRELKRMGAPFRHPEWSALALMDAPEQVLAVHQAFADAGADVLTTNTYAVVPFHVGEERFATQGAELIKRAATLARKAANTTKRVAGCIPPAFGSYRPDLFDAQRAPDIYKPLITEQEALVDVWLVETVSSLAEAAFIVPFIRSLSDKPIWLAFTLMDQVLDCTAPTTTSYLRSGEATTQAVQFAKASKVEALLFNCSQPEQMEAALTCVHDEGWSAPFGAYANAFMPIGDGARVDKKSIAQRQDLGPQRYVDIAKTWVELGATIIGGCCGIGPDYIRALQSLKEL